MGNSIMSTPRTHNTDLKFWLMWVIASMVAIWLSFAVISAFIIVAKAISPSINEDRLAGVIKLPIAATTLGVAQWLVLRSRIPKSGWRILATTVGIVGGIALAGGVVQVISRITRQEWNWDVHPGLLILYVLIGLLLALVQLPILWRYLRSPILWLFASMIGWFILGLIVDISIDRTSDFFAVGAIPAIFTGLCLIWLKRNPRTESGSSLKSISLRIV